MPLYIPPQGFFFRLKTCPRNTTLFLGADESLTNEPTKATFVEGGFFGDGSGPSTMLVPIYQSRPADTWLWEIIPFDNNKPRDTANAYKIRNKRTNSFLSLSPEGSAQMTGDPSMITIDSLTNQRFRLRRDDFVLFSRDRGDPHVGTFPADSTHDDDDGQQFEFDYQHLKFNKLVYHVAEATIQDASPFILIDQIVTNDTGSEQKGIPFSCNQTVTNTSTFEYTMGITIDAAFEFKAGVPTVNVESKIAISNSHNWKWGTENTTTTEYKLDYPLNVLPFTEVEYHAEVTQGTLHVPFTAYHNTDSGVDVETMGIYKGASSWKLNAGYKEKKLPNHPGELTRNSLPSSPPSINPHPSLFCQITSRSEGYPHRPPQIAFRVCHPIRFMFSSVVSCNTLQMYIGRKDKSHRATDQGVYKYKNSVKLGSQFDTEQWE